MKNWYIVQSHSSFENKVAGLIKEEAEKAKISDKFEEIIAVVALFSPGPMDNIPSFCNRKHGRENIDYIHPMLKDVLRETYGIIVYQEQVMEIAQVLSNYTLGEADLLRRAMGKKIQKEMDDQKTRFIDGALKNNISKNEASKIFELNKIGKSSSRFNIAKLKNINSHFMRSKNQKSLINLVKEKIINFDIKKSGQKTA